MGDISAPLSEAAKAQMPSKTRLKRTIQRARAQDEHYPANPTDRTTLVIPQQYQQLDNGEQFLLFDSGPGHDRILIFSTGDNLHLLSQSAQWLADGTFKTAPGIFAQVYSIHAVRCGRVVPLVYSLLPNKTQVS